jgi:hypothetical protein
MDPEANKTEQIALACMIQTVWDNSGDRELTEQELIDIAHNAQRLAELVHAYHEWMERSRPVSSGF